MSVKYWLDCNPQSGKVLMRHRSDGLNHRFRGAGPTGPPHSRRDQPRRISSLRLGGPQNPGPHNRGFPFAAPAQPPAMNGICGLEEYLPKSGDLEAIYRGNAERLLPRFKV